MTAKKISFVIPAFNEADGLPACAEAVMKTLQGTGCTPEILFVDDGSGDGTWGVLTALAAANPAVKPLRLSRNFGKEAALCAGLSKASGDACILLDADLQHPPSLVPEMVRLWRDEGFEIVDGVKRERQKEAPLSRLFANTFYGIVNRLAGLDLHNASDFKLLDRKAVRAFLSMPEHHPFFRGMSCWIGFRRTQLFYTVADRQVGTGKWSWKALFRLALNAITSFSTIPLQLVTLLGVVFFIGSVVLGLQTLYNKFFGHAVDGFSTVILLLLLIGSLIMFCLGVIGIYIAKIYEEVKARPRFIISDFIG